MVLVTCTAMTTSEVGSSAMWSHAVSLRIFESPAIGSTCEPRTQRRISAESWEGSSSKKVLSMPPNRVVDASAQLGEPSKTAAPKLTRQGVRALGTARSASVESELRALTCDHRPLQYCCPIPCGHLVCACGLSWDEGAER